MRHSSFKFVMRLSLLAGLLLALGSCSAASLRPEASSEEAGSQAQHQEAAGVEKTAQSADKPMELLRLNADSVSPSAGQEQQREQQQLEPVATASHQTRVSYRTVPLNMADLVMASHSIPAGRRRLDSGGDVRFVSSNQALLDGPESHPLVLSRETLVTAAALNRAANQRGPNMNRYEKIVDKGDFGAGSQLDDSRYPSAQLLAKLANENHNRLALSSSRRQQQTLMNQMARRQLDVGLGAGSNKRPRNEKVNRRQMARQESQRGPRRAKSMRAGRGARVGASDHSDDEYDELDGRGVESSNRDEDSASGEPEDGSEADDERTAERSSASSRRSSDPFFDEPEAEERRNSASNDANSFNNNDDELEENSDERRQMPTQRRQAVGGQQARSRPEARLRQAGGRSAVSSGAGAREIARRHQQNAAASRQKPQRELDAGEQNEDIDSMNSRQQLARASLRPLANNGRGEAHLRQPLAFDDVNSINGHADAGGHSLNTAAQFDEAQADNLRGADDSDLSASHIRNSATDLQVAAGHHHDHGHYYQHVEVPKKKAWKFGFKRGNHKHTIEKHEKGYKHKFHTKFKWHAKEKCKKKSKCESVGKMTWDYKHHKKHHP